MGTLAMGQRMKHESTSAAKQRPESLPFFQSQASIGVLQCYYRQWNGRLNSNAIIT